MLPRTIAQTPRTRSFGACRTALLAGLVVLAACSKAPDTPNPATPAGPPPALPVTVAAAIEREVSERFEFSGRLEAVEQVQLRSRVAGVIEKVHFTAGALVRKGDLLVSIDPRPFQQELSRQEASQAGFKNRLELARAELTRSQKLLAEQAATQREVDERAASVRDLEVSIRSAQASIDSARLNLSFTRLTAPISGRIGRAELTAGNLVEANGAAAITSIVANDPIYLSFDADERLYLRLGGAAQAVGAKVAMGLSNEAGFPHAGKIAFVDNRLDPASGTIRLRAVFANPKGQFTPGLFARVRLDQAPTGASKAVLVAEQAIGTDQNRKFVVVVGANNAPEQRAITVGSTSDDPALAGLRVILSGLKAGEKVVVNGLQRIRPGMGIAPSEVPMLQVVNPPAADSDKAKK